ncbi:MAG: flavodoxin-dependent (E)-4-hydroxy-3-methylbut-2-enyl-diphosphate synthase [Eubacteriales bacterium]|nr:flavodoxin-dependent (E)-4-hydroxy-3-methylbut-2-enyl-diphosphate synthase [Eubacteriales bacterium]
MNYNSIRRHTSSVTVGNIKIGGDNPISIQSMTNTDTHDTDATERQIRALADSGCDIVRLAVPDIAAADTFSFIKARGIKTPLVADIHFDYKIALACIKAGADKIRINPGNIGARERVVEVARACEERNIPIRIGVNSGSLEKHILEKYGAPTAEALAESALYHANILESVGFSDIVISVKASDVFTMVETNKILAKETSYPLHLGVTEAGGIERGRIKSAVGIGALLTCGIGDTIRVSLTADPLAEISAARDILASVGMLKDGKMDIISCPTCGRTKINLISLLSEFEEAVKKENLLSKPIKVAFMGCVVNGPGEAREADIGIAGGIGEALLFKHGETVCKIPSDKIISTLIDEIKRM